MIKTPKEIFLGSRTAQYTWGRLNLIERHQCLEKLIPLLKSNREEMARLISLEVKKPLNQAKQEVDAITNETKKELDDALAAFSSRTIVVGKTTTEMLYSPLGISLIISTWNSPLYLMHFQCLISLLAGNSVIVKPSEKCPEISLLYLDILSQVLPKNIFQIGLGDSLFSKSLIDEGPDLITFTGSFSAGMDVAKYSSQSKLTRLILELGGKGFLLVLSDASLDEATDFAIHNSFRHSGQVCLSTEVIFIHELVYEEFKDMLIGKLRKDERFNPMVANDLLGQMIDEESVSRWKGLVQDSLRDGGEVLFGGKSKKLLVEPTVTGPHKLTSPLLKKEFFCPLVNLVPYTEIDSFINWENNLEVGLGGNIFSKNEEFACEIALSLRTAMIGINRGAAGPQGTPFLGAVNSGLSFYRSDLGHRNFAQLRIINRRTVS